MQPPPIPKHKRAGFSLLTSGFRRDLCLRRKNVEKKRKHNRRLTLVELMFVLAIILGGDDYPPRVTDTYRAMRFDTIPTNF